MALALSRGRIREPDGSLKRLDFFKPPGRTETEMMTSYSTVAALSQEALWALHELFLNLNPSCCQFSKRPD